MTITNEEKQLLLKDLCARLPYGFLYCYTNEPLAKGKPIILTPVVVSNIMNATDNLVVRPYLRSMSSMTEAELERLKEIENMKVLPSVKLYMTMDFLNSIHIDYRDLIKLKLALEAPEEMYNTK